MNSDFPRKRLILIGIVLVAGLFVKPTQVHGQTFSVTPLTSDYYIYFRWTEAQNACVFFPWTQYIIRLTGSADALHTVTYSGIGWAMPANHGTEFYYEAGPHQTKSFEISARHYGTGCDYGTLETFTTSTNSLRPPRGLTASYDKYDNKIVLNWSASNTDVPPNLYQYRIMRSGTAGNIATVNSGVLTWTDTSAVPGVDYVYQVYTYAPKWDEYSVYVSDTGRVFNLNVRTESLSSGVKIIWDKENSDALDYNSFTIERQDGDNTPDFLITINSSAATSWTDVNAGGLPLPGYSYRYIVTPASTDGKTYRPGSAYGSRLPDGGISGYVKAPFGGGVQGVTVNVERTTSVPQGDHRKNYSAVTDANGYYEIQGIYYYDEASFTITPTLEGHGFRPVKENRTLSLANNVISNINFTDTSSFTVNCQVRQLFGGKVLDVAGVEIVIDDIPRGFISGVDGTVMATVAEIEAHKFSPRFTNHLFSPSDTTIYVSDNIDGLLFYDTTLFQFSGKVSGPCGIIIGTAELHIKDSAGAIDTVISSDQEGDFSVFLPGRKYSVQVSGFTPDDPGIVKEDSVLSYFSEPEIISLDTGASFYEFVYRKKPTLLVSGFLSRGCGGSYDGIPVFEQARPVTLQIEVREYFGDANCLVDSGYVIISHNLEGGVNRTDTIVLQEGKASYDVLAGVPNLIAPHLYNLEMTACVGNVTDRFTTQVLVTGNRPREQTFTTVSPQVPFMILRDPPGDGSYSYLSENSSFSTAMSLSAKVESSVNAWAQVKLGAEYEAGQFIFTKFKAWGQVKASLKIGASLAGSTELTMNFSTTEKISTSGNPDVIGAEGDVFIGAALNLVYAITDVIEYNTVSCDVEVSKQLIMCPDGFHTTFMYTEDHIRNVLIPQLEQIRSLYEKSDPDSAVIYRSQISVWQQTLDRNDTLKMNAQFIENRSISAGVPFESSQEITTSTSNSIAFSSFIDANVATEVGLEIGGSGASAGVEASLRVEVGASSKDDLSFSRTTGYVLSDDDAGDYFSVDILSDPAYSVPVFRLAAGRSSCPWEKGTQPRDGVKAVANTHTQTDVNSRDAAVFTLTLYNTSQSDEERTYHLKFLQESNPYGALLTLGGSEIQGGIPTPFTIAAADSVKTTVTVRKGPEAPTYNGLRFVVSSPCDASISDEIVLNVSFCDSCSSKDNHKPVISTLKLDTALIEEEYTFQFEAADPDSDLISWYLLRGPEGAELDAVTGIFKWLPEEGDEGDDTIQVRVTDGVLSDTASFVIHVKGLITPVKWSRPVPKVLAMSMLSGSFSSSVKLMIAVPPGEKALTLKVYDISGKVRNTWTISGVGYHYIEWKGSNAKGSPMPTGIFIARLYGGSKSLQSRLVVLK